MRRFNFSRIYKSIDPRRYNFPRIYKYDDFKIFKFSAVLKIIDLRRYKNIQLYGGSFVVFSVLIYLSIPIFFNYDKLEIENKICKNLNIKCSIQGKIRYSFLPSPRIKFNDFIIKDFTDKKKILGTVKNVAIKLSVYNLLNKRKFHFTKIKLQKAEINLDINKFKEYKIIYYAFKIFNNGISCYIFIMHSMF